MENKEAILGTVIIVVLFLLLSFGCSKEIPLKSKCDVITPDTIIPDSISKIDNVLTTYEFTPKTDPNVQCLLGNTGDIFCFQKTGVR